MPGINIKKVYRIYKELGMKLRNRAPKCPATAKLRDNRTEVGRPDNV